MNCPYCSADGRVIREFQRRNEETLFLWGCPSCECEFLAPQPSDSWLAKEYSGYFNMRHGRIPPTKSRLCQMILSKLAPLKDDARILDIGGGEGFFVKEVLKTTKNVHITLVEPQADDSALPPDRVVVHRKLIEEWLQSTPPEQYDAIVAMDLIEHLRTPLEVMSELVTTRLKPGGSLILTTPDASSYFRKIMRSVWPHYKVEHLTYPSPDALKRFAESAGLEVCECSSLAKPLQVGYLIAVLKKFGPTLIRKFGVFIDAICPTLIRSWHVKIPSGEILFLAGKKN